MPALHSVLLIQSNCLSSSVYNTGWYSQVYHRPITHFTLMCWFACIIIIEGGAYSVFKKSACLILWPMRWAAFWGRPLRCYKYKWKNDFFSFLNPGDGHNCKAHQSNALLQYIYVLAGHGAYIHWLAYDLQYHQPGSTTAPVLKQ